jgi:pentatricopeptide repeat protein
MHKAIETAKDKVGGAPDARAYQCLIRVCVQQGNFNDALRVGQLMENNNVEFTSGIYDSLISACALSSSERLNSALSDLPIPTGFTRATAGTASARHPALDAAFSLAKDMKRLGMAPDRRIYCSLMRVCLSHGDVAATRSTFDDMQQAGIRPDIYAFNALMQGCAIERNLEGAMHVLADMRHARVAPTIFTYSVVLNLCAELADSTSESGGVTDTDARVDGLAAVERVLARMEQQNIALNLVSYNTLIKACANSAKAAAAGSDWRRSAEVLDKARSYMASMKAGGISPDAATYNSLLQLCSYGPRLPKWDVDDDADDAQADAAPGHELTDAAAKFDSAVDEIVQEMNERGVRPDGATATLLISHFSERDPLRAFAVLADMKRAGVKPYLPSFTALITACRHIEDPDIAEVRRSCCATRARCI